MYEYTSGKYSVHLQSCVAFISIVPFPSYSPHPKVGRNSFTIPISQNKGPKAARLTNLREKKHIGRLELTNSCQPIYFSDNGITFWVLQLWQAAWMFRYLPVSNSWAWATNLKSTVPQTAAWVQGCPAHWDVQTIQAWCFQLLSKTTQQPSIATAVGSHHCNPTYCSGL